MPRVISWNEAEWKQNLLQKLASAKKYRENFERVWTSNYDIMMFARGKLSSDITPTFENRGELETLDDSVDQGFSEVGMNYVFKFTRFFHSQLSANPPSVIARPASTDPVDHRKADAADRLVRYGMRDHNMQELVDNMTLDTLIIGSGFVKQVWNPEIGDVFDFNEETSMIDMEGDIESYSPHILDIWLDPDAKRWQDVRFIFERKQMALEAAQFMWPDNSDLLEALAKSSGDSKARTDFEMDDRAAYEPQVEIFEYYEKGLPYNGMAGRHAFFLENGALLGEPGKNPHYQAKLPYHMFTYLDVPNQVYGKSVIEYTAALQDMLNRLDSSVIDNIQAHGVIRMAIHSNSDIEDEAISNSSWDWIKYSGDRAPQFLQTPQLMPDIWKFRDQLVIGIQELFGVNDSMLGIQRREQSAVSQQSSVESGTMIHRRLYKKYAMVVESIYKDYLGLIKENWDIPRTVLVLGKEKAFEAADIKGADISGGFDIVVEYGASLPIDPTMRREALMLLTPMLKAAGMSDKSILRHMKVGDLETIYDRMDMAQDRQREVFEEMISSLRKGNPIYIAPEEIEEHAGRLDYAYTYVESSEFKYLEPDAKDLIRKHISQREKLAAAAQAPMGPADPGVGPAGQPGVGGAMAPQLQGVDDIEAAGIV